MKSASQLVLLPTRTFQDPSRGAKIRWEKCDTDLYREIVQESLSAAPILAPLSDLDRAGRDDVTTGKLFPNRGECLGLYRCGLIIFKRK